MSDDTEQTEEAGGDSGQQPMDDATAKREEVLGNDPRHAFDVEHEKHRRTSIEKAMEGFNTEVQTDEAFRDAREARAELKDTLPGLSLSDVVEFVERTHEGMSDPSTRPGTAEWLTRYFAAYPTQFGRKPNPEPENPTFADQFAKAQAELEDRDQLKEAMKKHGPKLGPLLRQAAGFMKLGLEDPAGAAAKIMATYGEPITPAHRAEYQQEREANAALEQRIESVRPGVERVIESGKLPGLEREDIQNAVADMLESPEFPRSGNPAQDLYDAYQMVAQGRLKDEARSQLQDKAALSTTGGRSGSAEQSASRPGSAREALQRQFTTV